MQKHCFGTQGKEYVDVEDLTKRDAKLREIADLCKTPKGRCSIYGRTGFFKNEKKIRTTHSGVDAIRWIGTQIEAILNEEKNREYG